MLESWVGGDRNTVRSNLYQTQQYKSQRDVSNMSSVMYRIYLVQCTRYLLLNKPLPTNAHFFFLMDVQDVSEQMS